MGCSSGIFHWMLNENHCIFAFENRYKIDINIAQNVENVLWQNMTRGVVLTAVLRRADTATSSYVDLQNKVFCTCVQISLVCV